MPRKVHSFHFIYKTTNLINEKFYIGMHSTSNLEDGYLGSGRILRRSIKKYGIENFQREILEYCKNRDELCKREKELVGEIQINDSNCMNISHGGSGGIQNEEHKKKFSANSWNSFWKKYHSDENVKNEHLKKLKKIGFQPGQRGYDWNGKKHKEETKIKIGLINSILQKGEGNSQFGSKWVNNGIEIKKIKSSEIENYILSGWKLGRKIK